MMLRIAPRRSHSRRPAAPTRRNSTLGVWAWDAAHHVLRESYIIPGRAVETITTAVIGAAVIGAAFCCVFQAHIEELCSLKHTVECHNMDVYDLDEARELPDDVMDTDETRAKVTRQLRGHWGKVYDLQWASA